MEDKRKLNKSLFKAEIKLIKIIPFLLALIYFTNTIVSVFGIDLYILSIIGYNIDFGTAWFWLVLHILLFGVIIAVTLYLYLKNGRV